MAVGAGFGVDEEAVKEPEALRERVMIGSNYLRRAIGAPCRFAIAKNRKGRLAIGGMAVTGSFHVSKHLIVGAVFLDDVNNVLDGAFAGKEFWRREVQEAVVLHRLLRVVRQRGIVGKCDHADVSGNDRAAVLAALTVFLSLGRKRCVRRIRGEAAVANARRGRFESRSFAISELPIGYGNVGRILSGGNEAKDF